MYGELKFYKNKMKQIPGSQQETAKSALVFGVINLFSITESSGKRKAIS